MKPNQKLTPKYWVGHHKKFDDVIIQTLNKSKQRCLEEMEALYGEDWFMDDNFDIILIEIKEIDLV